MEIKTFANRAITEFLGFGAASNVIKPVHIANGLARAVLGGFGDVAPLHEVMRLRDARHGASLTAATLRDQIVAFRDCPDDLITDIRTALNELYNADHGVHGTAEFSSYTLTHRSCVTSDRSDQRTGDFLHQVLTAKLDGHSGSSALDALARCLKDDSDELTTAAWPLLSPKWSQRGEPTTSTRSLSKMETQSASGYVLAQLRMSMDRLSEWDKATPKLLLLRRLTLLGSVGIHFHLVQLSRELADPRRIPNGFCPILLDFSRDSKSAVAAASKDSLTIAMQSVGELTRQIFTRQLKKEYRGTDDALSQSVFDIAMDKLSGTPEDFAYYIGLRCGLTSPRVGRGRKGYHISLELAEILVLAALEPGEVLTVEELLQRWWESFGLVVGGRPGELKQLNSAGITRVVQENLDENVDDLIAMLAKQGLARRYGDGVRQVGVFAA
jgi:hypothetical protein